MPLQVSRLWFFSLAKPKSQIFSSEFELTSMFLGFFLTCGYQVSVNDPRRVNVFEAAENLVKEVLVMLDSQLLAALYYFVQVCFHQGTHHIKIVELFKTVRQDDSSVF